MIAVNHITGYDLAMNRSVAPVHQALESMARAGHFGNVPAISSARQSAGGTATLCGGCWGWGMVGEAFLRFLGAKNGID